MGVLKRETEPRSGAGAVDGKASKGNPVFRECRGNEVTELGKLVLQILTLPPEVVQFLNLEVGTVNDLVSLRALVSTHFHLPVERGGRTL
jgi:hypothetical protein